MVYDLVLTSDGIVFPDRWLVGLVRCSQCITWLTVSFIYLVIHMEEAHCFELDRFTAITEFGYLKTTGIWFGGSVQ